MSSALASLSRSSPRRHVSSAACGTAITSVAPLLQKVVRDVPSIFDGTGVTEAPVAQFYDMDLWDQHLDSLKSAFGPTFQHAMAIKSNSVSKMLRHAFDRHGMGIECASIGEVLHAQRLGIPNSHIVFDSPCKTEAEQVYALTEKIHTNLDNFVDFERARKFVNDDLKLDTSDSKSTPGRVVGFRINPLVGAGEIAALSVSTAESKFGVAVSEKEELIKAYVENPWLNSMHIHVGSGGMGLAVLTGGVRVLVDLAKEINSIVKHKQITHLDIGGGLPANYGSDAWATENVPTHLAYAQHLRREIPELFTGEFHVITEFGQSLFAKCGFLASRVEWIKGTSANPIAIIHFGADSCVRQVYRGEEHKRRLEAYKEDGSAFENGAQQLDTSVGGPLCFQGDFVAKNIRLPRDLKRRDFIVMKDAGANTISMFSRHCSRFCPPVYGFRWEGADVSEVFELKPRETIAELSGFWGKL